MEKDQESIDKEFKRMTGLAMLNDAGGRDEVPLERQGDLSLDRSILSTKSIAIVNQKGGCGKTTTALNVGACLANAGKKVLIIDSDPQAQSTSGLGLSVENQDSSLCHVLKGDVTFKKIIVPTDIKNLYIAASDLTLATAELEMAAKPNREFILDKAIKEHLQYSHYDFIIYDCSPTLNLVTVNVLVSTQYVLVPLQTHYFSLQGMKSLFDTIDLVKERLNPKLRILGILATFVNPSLMSNKILDQIRDYFKELVFKTVIHSNYKLAEAPIYGKPTVCLDENSRGSKEYIRLTREVTERVNLVSLINET